MNILILSLIVIGLVIHRYLTAYWENGILPYSAGFLMFANLFLLVQIVSFIWIFGFLLGVAVFLLTLFQIIYASYLWPFLLPGQIRMHKKFAMPTVNQFVYAIWPYIVMATGLLTIANFFVSDYGSLTDLILESINGDIGLLFLVIVGSMAVGNIARSICLKKLLNSESKVPKEIESAIDALDKIEQTLNNSALQTVRSIIEKMLFEHPNKYAEITSKNIRPRQWVLTTIANVAGDLVESGEYHVYRGVLMDHGKELLNLFDTVVDELIKMKIIDAQDGKEQKATIRENIKMMG
ncbi:MAG: hypothetical protein ABIH58_06645 [Patescibacteria group bacterium]